MNESLITPQNNEKTLWAINGLEQGRAIFLKEISDQTEIAKRQRVSFASAHEAYGVLLDDVSVLWDTVRQVRGNRNDLRQELVQIAATAIKALESLDKFSDVR